MAFFSCPTKITITISPSLPRTIPTHIPLLPPLLKTLIQHITTLKGIVVLVSPLIFMEVEVTLSSFLVFFKVFWSLVKKDYSSSLGKDYSSITKDYSALTKDYSKDYSSIGKDYTSIGKDYTSIGKDYSNIGKDYTITKDYSYATTGDNKDNKYTGIQYESTIKPESSSYTATSNVQNKQALKTDPKALLPIFSGETKYKDEPSKPADTKANTVVSKKDTTEELFNKFSNLTPNEITLKSNVGKALYAGSLAINSNDSVFHKELENSKKKGASFIDRDFPANMESLAGSNSDFKRQCGNVVWKRGDALFKGKNFKLFEGKIEPRDILQGSSLFISFE